MNQSMSTDKLFSHNCEDYVVSFESIAPKGNIQIMIPSDRPQYQPGKFPAVTFFISSTNL